MCEPKLSQIVLDVFIAVVCYVIVGTVVATTAFWIGKGQGKTERCISEGEQARLAEAKYVKDKKQYIKGRRIRYGFDRQRKKDDR